MTDEDYTEGQADVEADLDTDARVEELLERRRVAQAQGRVEDAAEAGRLLAELGYVEK